MARLDAPQLAAGWFTSTRLNEDWRVAQSLSAALVREAEDIRSKEVQELQSSRLAQVPGFRFRDEVLPLVLAVVLSQASRPQDIVPIALKLRESPEAIRFRQWIGELIKASRNLDLAAQSQAAKQLSQARDLLDLELRRILGGTRPGLIGRTIHIAQGVDLTGFVKGGLPGAVAKVAQMAIGEGLSALATRRVRSRIAVLISLTKSANEIERLNRLIRHVFKKELPPEEVLVLKSLRESHRKIMPSIFRT